jgi:hypothetical protein
MERQRLPGRQVGIGGFTGSMPHTDNSGLVLLPGIRESTPVDLSLSGSRNTPNKGSARSLLSRKADLLFQHVRPCRAWPIVRKIQTLLQLEPRQPLRSLSQFAVNGPFEFGVAHCWFYRINSSGGSSSIPVWISETDLNPARL